MGGAGGALSPGSMTGDADGGALSPGFALGRRAAAVRDRLDVRVLDLRRHAARRIGPHRRDVAAAAEGRRELVDHRRRPPVALVARVRPADGVDDVVGLGNALVGVARVVAVEVDRVAADEVLLQPQGARDLPVLALDDRPIPLREEVLELVGSQEASREADAVSPPQGLVEVVEVRAAVLVVLERAQRRSGGHDPGREAGEHGAGGQRAVRALERPAVELRDRRHAREARRVLVGDGLGAEDAVSGEGQVFRGEGQERLRRSRRLDVEGDGRRRCAGGVRGADEHVIGRVRDRGLRRSVLEREHDRRADDEADDGHHAEQHELGQEGDDPVHVDDRHRQQPCAKVYGTDSLPVPPYLSVVFMNADIDPVDPKSLVTGMRKHEAPSALGVLGRRRRIRLHRPRSLAPVRPHVRVRAMAPEADRPSRSFAVKYSEIVLTGQAAPTAVVEVQRRREVAAGDLERPRGRPRGLAQVVA